MTFKPLAATLGLVALFALPSQANAGGAGDILREALYGGNYRDVLGELTPLAAEGDQEAQFGIGFVRFVQSIEAFAQMLYFHGLAAPDAGPMGPPLLLPVPVNPDPTPLDYDTVRGILDGLVFNLDNAGAELLKAGESGDYVVLIDPLQIRIDVNGDGVSEEAEGIGQVLARAFGQDMPVTFDEPQRPTTAPGGDGRSGRGQAGPARVSPSEPAAIDTTVGFDRADAIWLAGYSNVLAAQADFFLAHDFSDFVNATFHRLFPNAKLPMQNYARGGMLVLDPDTDTAIADVIAGIHTLNWPVVEPDRLKGVLERSRRVLALSRQNWEAILAETDDERELVPSPRQTAIVPDGRVTDEVVAAWLETLDTAEQILDGELLVPHWRFKQGFDLKSYFETAKRTDLVMLLTGYDAIPFLRDGPVATAESFAAANRVFGNDILGYAFWFN